MRKTSCSKCKQPLGHRHSLNQRYCNSCHAEWMRLYRPKTKDLPEAARKRAAARAFANTYQGRGKILKQPCSVCGNPIAEKHHPDYNKPLYVVWLCREHHLRLHNKNKNNHNFHESQNNFTKTFFYQNNYYFSSMKKRTTLRLSDERLAEIALIRRLGDLAAIQDTYPHLGKADISRALSGNYVNQSYIDNITEFYAARRKELVEKLGVK